MNPWRRWRPTSRATVQAISNFEYRNPKQIQRLKYERLKTNTRQFVSSLWILDFVLVSDFDIRYSDLNLLYVVALSTPPHLATGSSMRYTTLLLFLTLLLGTSANAG